MAILTIDQLTFTYPIGDVQAINQVDLSVEAGDFVTLIGASGSGKSTLLKLIKNDIAPFGKTQGEIRFHDQLIEDYTENDRARKIGFVFQNPNDQIVMANVLDELVFGLENLQYPGETIRNKIAEVSQYFGIHHLLDRETETLSGGEKQLINLASVLALDPEILLLDEPTSQLDPIAAKRFIQTLKQVNDELGITVIIVEHRLEEILPLTDQIVLLKDGQVVYDGGLDADFVQMIQNSHLVDYLPKVSQAYLAMGGDLASMPVTVNQGRRWLEESQPAIQVAGHQSATQDNLVKAKAIDFQYQPNSSLVLNNLSAEYYKGSIHAVLGGNGSGKSTFLKTLAGIHKPQHGKFKWQTKSEAVAYVPQNPLLFFMEDRLTDEYEKLLTLDRVSRSQYERWLRDFQLDDKLEKHPQDLSGGESQKAALLGALLLGPDLLILDEPTKGLDPVAKLKMGDLLERLTDQGVSLIVASHDLDFVAQRADFIHFMFRGSFTNAIPEAARNFLVSNQYYTTSLKKMTTGFVDPPLVSIDELAAKEVDGHG